MKNPGLEWILRRVFRLSIRYHHRQGKKKKPLQKREGQRKTGKKIAAQFIFCRVIMTAKAISTFGTLGLHSAQDWIEAGVKTCQKYLILSILSFQFCCYITF